MILNILAVAIFILCIYINLKRGFAKSVMGILGFFLAFVIVASFGDSFTQTFRESDTGKAIESKIYNVVYEQLYSSAATDSASAVSELPLPNFIKQEAVEMCENFTTNVYDKVSSSISVKVFNLMCNVCFFIILILAFGVLKLIIPQIFKLPVLKQVNKALGLGLGAVSGVLWVYVFMLIVSVIVNMGSWPALNEAAKDSFIYNLVYENNIILKFFS